MAIKISEADQIILDMEELCALPAFLRILLRSIDTFGIHASTFTADAQTLAFNEGRRSAGMDILSWATDVVPNAMILALAQRKIPSQEQQHGRRRYQSESDE